MRIVKLKMVLLCCKLRLDVIEPLKLWVVISVDWDAMGVGEKYKSTSSFQMNHWLPVNEV